ncbi:YdcF family protein [Algihabitans albus]|uniref:YdcF family protein n=1 Tax=Algihabitans albus TaxID=2164067 RepID=UPI000E5C5A1C|nr:YdcF family protein [Algihabitans albus]
MLFELGKIFWMLANPATLLLILLLAGFGFLLLRWRQMGLVAVGAASLLVALPAFTPVERWLMSSLETRFPTPDLPERIDGIVVLGGGLSVATAAIGLDHAIGGGADRVTAAARLANRYPEAEILYSSGARWPADAPLSEADYAADLLEDLGVAPERIRREDRSRNTRENALYALEMADPQPGETWLLVTSAFHMPRAVACFRAVGWTTLPYPVDRRLAPPRPGQPAGWFGPGGGGFGLMTTAVKEYVGLLAYRLAGWTEEVFPRPQP